MTATGGAGTATGATRAGACRPTGPDECIRLSSISRQQEDLKTSSVLYRRPLVPKTLDHDSSATGAREEKVVPISSTAKHTDPS